MEPEPWFLSIFPSHFSLTGVFCGSFFLASDQTAFALLAVAQLYLVFVRFSSIFVVKVYIEFFFITLYVGVDDPEPNCHKA